MFSTLVLGAMLTVIHSSDGGIDDFIATAVISAAQEKNKNNEENAFQFPAVIITNADCEPVSAFSAYHKTTNFLNMGTTEVAMSSSRVWTQFPWQWRLDSKAMDQLPCLQNQKSPMIMHSEGNALLADMLRKYDEVKIIATGPLTTIADVLKTYPELIEKIHEIHWMGGAVDITGNISNSPEIPKELLNESAEWNVFSDPEAADWVFRNTSFPIHLYPLDISEDTIPRDFMKILDQKKATPHSVYVSECCKLVEHLENYRMWDIVAAAGVFLPEVFQPPIQEKLSVEIDTKEQGALIRNDQGREVHVYTKFKDNNPDYFYEAVANLLVGS